ncbi:Uncharacterised protein [Candidatus Anstonella stagnisolia]|nr:Uncharacterised protein [Candidatus Anstonella stagnisolia]
MGSGVARALALFLCCLFSLFSFSHAAPNQQWGAAGDVMLYAFLALAVALSAAFIGLAYMASQIFNVPALGAWVKIEVQELVVSVIIVVLIVGMTASLNSAVAFATGTDGYYDAAVAYLDGFRDLGLQLHQKLLHVGYLVNLAAGFSYSVSVSAIYAGANFSSAPRSGLGGLVGAVGNAVDSVALTVLFISAQKVFLVFFVAISSIIMPMGVVLRTFPFTRKLGALLLSAGVCTAVVYPTALVLSKEIYNVYGTDLQAKVANADKGVPNLGSPPGSGTLCSPAAQWFASGFGLGDLFWSIVYCVPSCALSGPLSWACYNACSQGVSLVYSLITSSYGMVMWPVSVGYIGQFNAGDYFTPVNENSLPAATDFSVLALVFSLIPIIITIVLVRNFSNLFGGESQLYGLFKLVG